MPRLFSDGATMVAKRFYIGLALLLAASAGAARAEDAPAAGCTLGSVNILSLDQGEVSINCTGLNEAFGRQFAEILTRILRERLDPQTVMAKLDEVDRAPAEGVARIVDENQKQVIIQSLVGKPSEQIAITAHPMVEDSAEFAKAIATPLLMVGWQIEGHQIRRAAPKSLDPVSGLVIVVRERNAPPPKALQLKTALSAARIGASLMSDPALPPDAVLLWVGRRPQYTSTEAAK